MKRWLEWGCGAIILMACTFGGWRYRWAGPTLTLLQGRDGSELSNMYLGEYFLELDDLRVSDTTDGTILVNARAAGAPLSKLPFSIPLQSGADIREALKAAGWAVQSAQEAPIVLQCGRRYTLRVRGNNGFGYVNETHCVVSVEETPRVRCGLFR